MCKTPWGPMISDIRNHIGFTKHGNLQPQCSPQLLGPSWHQGGWLPHTERRWCLQHFTSSSYTNWLPDQQQTQTADSCSSQGRRLAPPKQRPACFNIQVLITFQQAAVWILCQPSCALNGQQSKTRRLTRLLVGPQGISSDESVEKMKKLEVPRSRMIKDQSYSEWDQFFIPQKFRCYMLLPLPQQAWQSSRSDSEAHSSITNCNHMTETSSNYYIWSHVVLFDRFRISRFKFKTPSCPLECKSTLAAEEELTVAKLPLCNRSRHRSRKAWKIMEGYGTKHSHESCYEQ